MQSRKLHTSLFLFLVFIIIFFLKENFNGALYQDENHYLPTAVFFSQEPIPSIDLLKSYNELNTPLPFILGGWVVHFLGENIQYLRLLTYGVSFLLLMVFVWFSPERSRRFFLCLGGLILFPNYYLISVFYYTDIFAMVAVLAGTVAYLNNRHILGAVFFIAGICCRQYMLAFPAAIVLYELLQILKNSTGVKQFVSSLFLNKTWMLYAVAVISIVPWVILWHGPAPAAVMADQHYDSDKLVQYNFGYVLYSSVCLAVYYVIPEMLITGKLRYFIDYPRNYPRFFVLFLVVILGLIVFFPAKQAYNPYFTWPYLGYIDQLFMTVGITGFLKQICFGLLMLLTLMRFVSPHFNLAGCVVLFNVLLLGKAQLSWDKYSLPMIMILWFVAMFDEHWALTKYTKPLHQ
ncbi:hypothetical protein [Dyadobacter psychrotolerans]|uniref:Glycosyltransferase RgtA/B/C/D-like domain-containing protein n=1 Tax=Dyadobacter psychrotolerans TaxID=2541721 RepID=A0A4R5D8S4_9BACT|nr:hypothetical protein [Dyadobacter psychrotolerans]TDE09972.1 hypothetical protein E0F88_29020 [Dyadobacter psychrotolerans]